jgi:hypothetical protein
MLMIIKMVIHPTPKLLNRNHFKIKQLTWSVRWSAKRRGT